MWMADIAQFGNQSRLVLLSPLLSHSSILGDSFGIVEYLKQFVEKVSVLRFVWVQQHELDYFTNQVRPALLAAIAFSVHGCVIAHQTTLKLAWRKDGLQRYSVLAAPI